MENKREWIDFLLKKSKFNLTEEEKIQFDKDLDIFIEQLKSLDDFELDSVRPQTAPFEKKETMLRPDVEVIKNRREIVLENASKVKDGYIFLDKEDK